MSSLICTTYHLNIIVYLGTYVLKSSELSMIFELLVFKKSFVLDCQFEIYYPFLTRCTTTFFINFRSLVMSKLFFLGVAKLLEVLRVEQIKLILDVFNSNFENRLIHFSWRKFSLHSIEIPFFFANFYKILN